MPRDSLWRRWGSAEGERDSEGDGRTYEVLDELVDAPVVVSETGARVCVGCLVGVGLRIKRRQGDVRRDR